MSRGPLTFLQFDAKHKLEDKNMGLVGTVLQISTKFMIYFIMHMHQNYISNLTL